MGNQETYHIGIILPNFMVYTASGMLDYIAKVFSEQGHIPTYACSGNSVEQERKCIEELLPNVDGLIMISCAEDYSMIEDLIPDDFPIIFLLNHPNNCKRTVILENDYSAIYQGMLSLAPHNISKVAIIMENPDTLVGQSYLKAFKDALNTLSIEFTPDMVYTVPNFTQINPTQLFTQIIANGCDAIFATSSALTISLSDCLVYYNHNVSNTPIPLLGYGVSDINIASSQNIDLIIHSVSEFATLAYQTLIYQIRHPDKIAQDTRILQLKGSLQMHKYNGMNVIEPIKTL